jgi:hypothetical protein
LTWNRLWLSLPDSGQRISRQPKEITLRSGKAGSDVLCCQRSGQAHIRDVRYNTT